MEATAAPSDNEIDLRRELPGGGELFPKDHVVRIVVVRHASDSTAARESDGLGEHHDLTKDELRAAEHELKTKAAPPPDGTSGSDARSEAENMFEALKPTDIVVVGREPASVRTVDSHGKPKLRELDPHNDHNRDTVLRVWTESDTIEYQCDERFEIVKMERAGWKIYNAPENPFASKGDPPYRAEERQGPAGKLIWSWKSDRLPATANNQQYKMTFEIFDDRGRSELVDPDVACGDPPPRP